MSTVSFLLMLSACSSTAPRYRSPEKTSPYIVQDDDEFRFAENVKAEEMREDDKKVDISAVRTRLTPTRTITKTYSNKVPEGIDRDRLLLEAIAYLGAPYRFGGSSKNGLDCSALTSNVYASALGRVLPRSTREQYDVGAEVQPDSLQFGDLVFFNTTGRTPSHVGIYIEDDLFIHASISYGVTISSIESTYYRKRFVGARRVVH